VLALVHRPINPRSLNGREASTVSSFLYTILCLTAYRTSSEVLCSPRDSMIRYL
jgi:hypothetical protein